MDFAERKHVSKREINRSIKRDCILDIAVRTFARNGYAGTTMSSVAQEVGGSKGTLWSYFSSKAELFEEAIRFTVAAQHAELFGTLEQTGNLTDTLHRFAASFIATVTSPKAVAIRLLVQAESKRFPEVGSIFFKEVVSRTNLMLADFLSDAMEQLQLREDDPHDASRVFIALCLGGKSQQIMLNQKQSLTPAEIDFDARLAVRVFLRAYDHGEPRNREP